ncbi:Os02g0165900 [Oryza sativa Japonica Group]|uniref:Os02g0165900 protein n=1 Tax=Oryza sativa subsp. japonica TaxID=39947 RepID=Q0E3M5_ORYSJ|nr:Os02g0165900 [Oryza sativa Japonica Group]|eukprot:NP_001045999.1 Os02g0165900 [Oryza sativa Japonica Group]
MVAFGRRRLHWIRSTEEKPVHPSVAAARRRKAIAIVNPRSPPCGARHRPSPSPSVVVEVVLVVSVVAKVREYVGSVQED